MRRLYQWVLHWAESPYSGWALFLIAVAESSFFPCPPDALLIPLALAAPYRSLRYALICTVGSVLGGMMGYVIGWQLMETIGHPILQAYGLEERFLQIQSLYRTYDALAVGIAGFSPLPYKLFTIGAGAFSINFPVFVLASIVGRGSRFFLVGGLIALFGPRIRPWIERYFTWLVVAFTLLLVLGFAVFKFLH
jgi:membrane protein YqaA with SNARE-associated domain